ncbi:APC family permease [Gemmatimonadota bacterium]
MSEKRLKKHLNLTATFAFSIGPMLSAGVFLLPALVFSEIGPAAILVYLIAGLLLIPSLLCQAELATAMPRAGGTYYFLDRSLGALVGTVAGAGTWLALTFKSAFDLIGLGAYLVLFLDLPIKPVAVALHPLCGTQRQRREERRPDPGRTCFRGVGPDGLLCRQGTLLDGSRQLHSLLR